MIITILEHEGFQNTTFSSLKAGEGKSKVLRTPPLSFYGVVWVFHGDRMISSGITEGLTYVDLEQDITALHSHGFL